MREKKGFTLIELLAVIVVLAIIALIATPIIINLIEKARIGAATRSAEGVRHVAKVYYSTSLLENIYGVTDEEFICDGISCKNDKNVVLNIDGKIPSKGTVYIKNNGNVYSEGLTIDGFLCDFDNDAVVTCISNPGSEESGEGVIEDEEDIAVTKVYADSEVVYYNPITGKVCTDYHEDNSLNDYNGEASRKTTANQNGCLKWYAFNDKEGESKVNLLLDHNSTAIVMWNSAKTGYGVEAVMGDPAYALLKDTSSWKGVPYVDQRIDEFDYTNYRARLITMDEVNELTTYSATNTFDRTSNISYTLDEYKGNYDNNLWLMDGYKDCGEKFGCSHEDTTIYPLKRYVDDYDNGYSKETYGFWTSTYDEASDSPNAWVVSVLGIKKDGVSFGQYGVRPVITLSKAKLENGGYGIMADKVDSSTVNINKALPRGTAVYFNPITGKECSSEARKDVGTFSTIGCSKWYVFKDSINSDTVNMIAEANISDEIAWNTTNNYSDGPVTLLQKLNEKTKYWYGVEPINETIDNINYNGYKARLISAYEIANIIGRTDFQSLTYTNGFSFKDGRYYANANEATIGASGSAKYKWLYNYIYTSSYYQGFGNDQEAWDEASAAYWTSTPLTEENYCKIWTVRREGRIYETLCTAAGDSAIRPVIKVKKWRLASIYNQYGLDEDEPVEELVNPDVAACVAIDVDAKANCHSKNDAFYSSCVEAMGEEYCRNAMWIPCMNATVSGMSSSYGANCKYDAENDKVVVNE